MAKTKQTDNTLPAIFAGKGELAPSAQAALEMAGAAPAAEEAPDNTGTPMLNYEIARTCYSYSVLHNKLKTLILECSTCVF